MPSFYIFLTVFTIKDKNFFNEMTAPELSKGNPFLFNVQSVPQPRRLVLHFFIWNKNPKNVEFSMSNTSLNRRVEYRNWKEKNVLYKIEQNVVNVFEDQKLYTRNPPENIVTYFAFLKASKQKHHVYYHSLCHLSQC